MRKIHLQRGVTLIETMVYLALFALIIGGAVLSAYQIFESSGRSRTRSMLTEEGNFLSGKMLWALSGAHAVDAPAAPAAGAPCTQSNTLSVTKWDTTIGVLVFAQSGGDLTLARSGGGAFVINNSNVAISALNFKHCYKGGFTPESIEIAFTLSARTPSGAIISQDFSTGASLRK